MDEVRKATPQREAGLALARKQGASVIAMSVSSLPRLERKKDRGSGLETGLLLSSMEALVSVLSRSSEATRCEFVIRSLSWLGIFGSRGPLH